MSNGTEHTDGNPRAGELLNRLIRMAAEQAPRDFTWPPDEDILAYIEGNANETQHETIQTAIAQSSEFRRFIIDTADQLSAVTSDATATAFDSVQVPSSISRANGSTIAQRRRWFEALRRPRVLTPLIVGALALVIMLTIDPLGLFQRPAGMFTEYSELDRSEFVSLSPRGTHPEDSVPKAFMTAYDAAMNRLRESIAYELTSGGYKLSDGVSRKTEPATERNLVLRLLDKQGTEIGKITAPAYSDGGATAEAWIVVPPSLTLWHVPLPADSLDVTWPAPRPARGCVTVTERTDSGYVAAPGHIFQL